MDCYSGREGLVGPLYEVQPPVVLSPSMGSVGDCYDNALCESFFATLECELIDRFTFRNHDQARDAIIDFIEGFYNTHRRHSALGYHSPVQFERRQTVSPGPTNNLSTKPG